MGRLGQRLRIGLGPAAPPFALDIEPRRGRLSLSLRAAHGKVSGSYQPMLWQQRAQVDALREHLIAGLREMDGIIDAFVVTRPSRMLT